MIVADTSFLLSLYGNDPNTPAATSAFRSLTGPVQLHAFSDFEFLNAVRHLVFRGKITIGTAQLWVSAYQGDKAQGRLVTATSDPATILAEAMHVSAARTETFGGRAYDILHVAAAKVLGAPDFLSFDANQRKLAAAEGLIVGP